MCCETNNIGHSTCLSHFLYISVWKCLQESRVYQIVVFEEIIQEGRVYQILVFDLIYLIYPIVLRDTSLNKSM